MFNPLESNCVTLESFLGLVTLAPANRLSEGSSPLCWDVDFLVGSVFTRGGTQSVYSPAGNATNMTYVKTFATLDGQVYTLVLGVDGQLYVENVNSSPGTITHLALFLSNMRARSATAFQREYIATSSLTVGAPGDMPRQFDGTNLDRISQEGPGANGNFSTNLTNNPAKAPITSFSITGDVVTFQALNAFSTGNVVSISLPTITYLDGQVLTVSAASGTQFSANFIHPDVVTTVAKGNAIPVTGYPISGITQPGAQSINGMTWSSGTGNQTSSGNTVTVYYSTSPDNVLINAFQAGIPVYVYIVTSTPPFVTGTYNVTGIGVGKSPGSSTTRYFFTYQATSDSLFNGPVTATYELTQATVTMTTPVPNLEIGSAVSIQGATPAAWNNTWNVVSTPQSGTLAINNTSMSAGGTATYTFSLISGNNPVAGDMVTVQNTTNGNGIFNVTNAIIDNVIGSTFTIINFPAVAVVSQPETGQAQTFGFVFLIDPGAQFVGQPNATNPIFGNDTGTGTVSVIGNANSLQVSAGTRQAVIMFLTRNGYLTRPSPPVTFTTDASGQNIRVSNIPIGPSNVIARWIAFTEAGANGVPGAYFYVIPQPVKTIVNGQPFTYAPTVINDNTTTHASFNFSDAVLLSSLEIDIQGNNLFNLNELGSCAWDIQYAERMFYGGVENKVNNFLNMSFNGGYVPATNVHLFRQASVTLGQPLGWTVDAGAQFLGLTDSGASIIPSFTGFGDSLLIQNNSGSTQTVLGRITQSAYQDAYGVAILQPNTAYSVRLEARIPSGNTTGNLVIDLATFNVGQSSSSTAGAYGTIYGSITIPFASLTPAFSMQTGSLITNLVFPSMIPANLLIRVYATNIADGANIEVDHIEVYPTLEPVLSTDLLGSYVDNPESIDGVTGTLGVASTNQQPVNGAFVMYDQLYLLKQNSMFTTQDNPGSEPSGWGVHEVSNKVGACGINAYDVGEEWAVMACRSGVYVFFGQQPIKIMQEIYQVWDAVNWAAAQCIWVRNDIQNRRILVGVPMATPNAYLPNAPTVANPTSPNVILVCDYKGLGDVSELANSPQMHTTMFGTLMSVDMRRKWTIWQVTSPYADFVQRPDGFSTPLFLCNGASNGKVYQFGLPRVQLSDDGAAINSLYTTYGWIDTNKSQQNPLLGHTQMQWDYSLWQVTGGGNMTVNLLPGNVVPVLPYQTVTMPLIPLTATRADDYERSINVRGNRVFVQFSTNAVNAYFDMLSIKLFGRTAAITVRGNAAQ